jgi:hypothetical protein
MNWPGRAFCLQNPPSFPGGLGCDGAADHVSDRSRAQPSLVDSAKQMNL